MTAHAARADSGADTSPLTESWRTHVAVLGGLTAMLLLIFARDAADMVGIWWNASTYTHCLFILPIIGWLVWLRRDEVARIAPRGSLIALVPFALAALLWMIGQAGGIALFRHVALIVMVQAGVAIVLGPRVVLGLMFPLFYMVFLVPFGDELVPALQTITAKLCMVLLALTGTDATIDGVFIRTPAGLFEVAEACSGVKFLVAMAAYGALVANVCFKSWLRRGLFMLLALVVPVLANGIRAWGTIHISGLTSIEFAKSFDHVIYGWVFFAIVMAMVMLIGWRFFDRRIDDPWLSPTLTARAGKPRRPELALVLSALVIAAVPVAWQAAIAAMSNQPMAGRVVPPVVPGWQAAAIETSARWLPRFDRTDHALLQHYVSPAGDQVTLALAIYAAQAEGRELVGYGQGAYDPALNLWSWSRDTAPPPSGRSMRIVTAGAEREVVLFYVLGGTVTGDSRAVKLQTLRTRLIGGDQSAVAVVVSAEERDGKPARAAIDAFLKAMGDPGAMAAQAVAQAREARGG